MKVPLENTQLDVVITKLQNNEENEEFRPYNFGPFADPNFPVPNEIVIKIYGYLNILDLSECAQVSKRMRNLCFHHSLEFSWKFSMFILYKRTGPNSFLLYCNAICCNLYKRAGIKNVKELIKLGAYEQVKTNYGKIKARTLGLGLILHAHQCKKAKVSKYMLNLL